MTLSVVDPVYPALERVRHICFRPFDIGKWFVVGFCAFLAGFAEGSSTGFSFQFQYHSGGTVGPPGGGPPDGRSFAQGLREALDWVQTHLFLVLVISLMVLLLGIALGALFAWLGSRGQFMFLHNIVRNRSEVVVPWREYRKEGNSLFWFRFLFGLIVFVAFFGILLGAFLIAVPDIQAQQFGPAAGTALAVGIGGFLVVAFVSGVISLFLNDFVMPIMYLRRIGVLEAWRVFRTSLLVGHISTFVLYVLFKLVLSITVGFLTTLFICCTLCLALIPYLGSHVLMLPLHVFWRSYPLCFIEQFGPEWRFFSLADELFAELVEEREWPDDRFRPADEHIRPADDSIRPPDDRFRPE